MNERERSFDEEVARARGAYDAYARAGNSKSVWAPFAPAEAAFRSLQALALARLMFDRGFVDLAGKRVLDVGCGNGRQVRMFLDMGATADDVAGVDIHEPAIAQACAISPQMRFEVFNGWQLPFDDGAFDLVTQFVVFSSIATVELRQQLAREMVRVLRPGGYVFWWDMPSLSKPATGTRARLDPEELFEMQFAGRIRIRPPLPVGDALHLPAGVRRIVRPVVNRVPCIRHPVTHTAALIGPR